MNSQKTTLPTLRTKLDAIDGQHITLLAKRFELTRQVGEYKAKHNLPAIDLEREAEQFKRNWQIYLLKKDVIGLVIK